ncbi:hypothetical protein FHR72_001276 [Mycolicibacterium iranicum]|uniref:Uncharacterized protein n=1 Tax=Mycolicibacterium iranicum TaxID=912594 RepID=A0A839Q323_MYCIR|nr:hypothetical protein [Mycolicibacterium iranicum]MBB2989813.1 hypothetical protein [Mycolicibacterium iranicum]
MSAPAPILVRSAKTLGIAGFGAAVLIGLGSGTASADVEEVGPGPTVTSRQASENSVIRINDFGIARGISEARVGDAGVVNAQGEVRDSTKAVVRGGPRPFRGGFPSGPAIGDW